MIVIVGGRATGKTHAAISWLMEDPTYRCILVADESRRRQLLRQIQEYVIKNFRHDAFGSDFWSHKIATATQYPQALRGNACVVGIDNLEDVLRVLFQGRVDFATVNGALLPTAYEAQPIEPFNAGEGKIEYRPKRMPK